MGGHSAPGTACCPPSALVQLCRRVHPAQPVKLGPRALLVLVLLLQVHAWNTTPTPEQPAWWPTGHTPRGKRSSSLAVLGSPHPICCWTGGTCCPVRMGAAMYTLRT